MVPFDDASFGNAVRFLGQLFACAVFRLYYRCEGVVDIGRAVLVGITCASVTFVIKVAFSRANVINVQNWVIVISLAVIVSVALRATLNSKGFGCVRFPAQAVIICAFYCDRFSVTYDQAFDGYGCFRVAVAFPISYSNLNPIFLVRAVVCDAFRSHSIAAVNA